MRNTIVLCLFFCLLTASKCKKSTSNVDYLPPATQEGRQTLGFMMNGLVWTPSGISGLSPNLSADVDFAYRNGIFNITAYRIVNGERQQFSLGIQDSLNFYSIPKYIPVSPTTNGAFYFSKTPCVTFSRSANTYSDGYINVTKLDKINKIIAGTFNVTMCLTGCDTIRIVDGRFDLRY